MPRYFFSTPGDGYAPDDEGVVLSGPEDAKAMAVTTAGEILKDIDGKFWSGQEWRLHVTDENGATVCVLTMRGTTGER
jgi:hypothetical protein